MDKTVHEIRKQDVAEAPDEIGGRSGSTANKARKWLRQMFNWLKKHGNIGASPTDDLSRPFPETSRTGAFRCLREASNAPWSEFDLEAED